MFNFDWSAIWSSLLIPVGVVGGLISIVVHAINLIKQIFFKKILIKVDDYWFLRSYTKDFIDFHINIIILLTNKLDKDTTISNIILESKYSDKVENRVIEDLEKDKQQRVESEFFLGRNINKVEGKIIIIHTYGKNSVKIKAEFQENKEKSKVNV